MIDWSHDLLTGEERIVFRRLSVFAGGFTLQAAEAVCGSLPLPTRAIELALLLLGQATCHLRDNVAARAYLQEGLTISRKLCSKVRTARHLTWLGVLARIEGDYARARAYLEGCLALARESEHQAIISVTLFHLGSLAREEQDLAHAEALAKESVKGLRGNNRPAIAIGLCGVVAIARGQHRRGARLLGAAGHQAARRYWLGPDDRQVDDEAMSAARASLGDEAFATAWAEGQEMTLDQAVAYALEEDTEEAEGAKG